MSFERVAGVGGLTHDVNLGVLGRGASQALPHRGERVAAVPSIGRANRVEGAGAPEADATRELYERYANQIFRYCLHQLGSREEAEDAVQSTFLNAFRGLKRGVEPELESAWLFKIAHNVCLSRRRSSWRRGRVESPADFELVEELTPAPPRRADELIGLQDVLEQMPETQRRAILLREWQGLSYREIGDELEVSQAAVETLIFRARRALAAGLEQPPVAKRRAARALDWGNLIAGAKSLLLGGSAAAKVAATVAAVSATTVVAAEPVVNHRGHHQPTPARSVPHAKQEAKAPIVHAPPETVAAVVASVSRTIAAVPRRHWATRQPAHARRLLAPKAPAAQTVVKQRQPAAPLVKQHPAPPANAVRLKGNTGKPNTRGMANVHQTKRPSGPSSVHGVKKARGAGTSSAAPSKGRSWKNTDAPAPTPAIASSPAGDPQKSTAANKPDDEEGSDLG
jgi:RNA polymerase sigma factor (sigma-70 family)